MRWNDEGTELMLSLDDIVAFDKLLDDWEFMESQWFNGHERDAAEEKKHDQIVQLTMAYIAQTKA